MATPIDKLTSIDLGEQGEHLATVIEIDVSAWTEDHPSASFYITHKRHTDTILYRVERVEVEDDILRWTVTSTDTGISGSGTASIHAIDGEWKNSTGEITTNVEATLDSISGGDTALQAYLNALSEGVATNENAISINTGAISRLNTNLTGLTNRFNTLNNDYTYATTADVDAYDWSDGNG